MAKLVKKSFNTPDKTQSFPKGKVEILNLEGLNFTLTTFEPGWKWSESVKPITKTESCQALHRIYVLSGKLNAQMDDGTEIEFGPTDSGTIPPGHDAWTVGDESVVFLDISAS